jgi:hypothetical protein
VPLRPVSELGLVDITDVPARDGNRTATRRDSARTRTSRSQPPRRDSRDDHQTSTRSDRSEDARASRRGKSAGSGRASKNLAREPELTSPAKSPSGRAAKRLAPSESRAKRTPRLTRNAPVPAVDSGRAGSNTSASPSEASQRRSPRGPTGASSTRNDQSKVSGAKARPSAKPRRTSPGTVARSRRSGNTSKPASDTGSGAAARSATVRNPRRSNSATGEQRRATPAPRRTPRRARINANRASRGTQRSREAQTVGPTKPLSTAKIGVSVFLTAGLVAAGVVFARLALHR